MPRFALQIDLKKNRLSHCTGYPDSEPREVGAQVRAALQCDVGERTFFVRGIFHGMGGVAGFKRCLAAFTDELDAPGWAGRLRGDFTVVVWNRTSSQITAISDRVGAHRLFVHRAPNGVVTITSRIVAQIQLQSAPRLDDLGIYTMLTFGYPLDPHTLLADTRALTVGDIGRVTADSLKLLSYYEPVLEVLENHASIEEAVADIDRTLTQVLEEGLSDDRMPLLMLSGGIDSVALLDFLSRLVPDRINTFTFAVEGMKGDELGHARVAAEHYGSRHHEHIIPRAEVQRLTRKALIESETTTYGGFIHIGLSEWFARHESPLTIFRGEDTRLHTPALDLPALVGFFAHRMGLHKSPLGRRLWHTRRVASVWPFRKGRNYLSYILDRTDLTDGLRTYLLRNGSRFQSPIDGPMHPEVVRRTEHLSSCTSLEQAYRALIGLNYQIQYTENMYVGQTTNETANSNLAMPYYMPEVVRACNRVPTWMGLRPIFAPGKTSSPIPVAAKYVLRKLVAGRAPEKLLFRRKAVAPAEDVLYAEAGARTIFPAVRDWSATLLDQLEGDTRLIAEHLLRQFLHEELNHVTARRGSKLLHLTAMARLCAEPSADLAAEIEEMEPWAE